MRTKTPAWSNNEEKQKTLADLLSHPTMQEALRIVKDEMIPIARIADDPAHVLTLMALDQARAAGWHAALRCLASLASPPAPPTQVDTNTPWKHKQAKAEKKTTKKETP